MAHRITYLKAGKIVNTTVVDELTTEMEDKILVGLSLYHADDFEIAEGSYRTDPRRRGAVIFTEARA